MDPPPPSLVLEELTVESATSLVLPYILAMSPTPRHIAVFLNPETHSVNIVEGYVEFENDDDVPPSKDPPLPASKASIEALPVVKVSGVDMECPVCLVEIEVGGQVKEMPCKHMFCKECIDKWLGMHASCPVCRFCIPVQVQEIEEERVEVDVEANQESVQIVFYRGSLEPADQDLEDDLVDQQMVIEEEDIAEEMEEEEEEEEDMAEEIEEEAEEIIMENID